MLNTFSSSMGVARANFLSKAGASSVMRATGTAGRPSALAKIPITSVTSCAVESSSKAMEIAPHSQ